jgi:hypothetical protein
MVASLCDERGADGGATDGETDEEVAVVHAVRAMTVAKTSRRRTWRKPCDARSTGIMRAMFISILTSPAAFWFRLPHQGLTSTAVSMAGSAQFREQPRRERVSAP